MSYFTYSFRFLGSKITYKFYNNVNVILIEYFLKLNIKKLINLIDIGANNENFAEYNAMISLVFSPENRGHLEGHFSRPN